MRWIFKIKVALELFKVLNIYRHHLPRGSDHTYTHERWRSDSSFFLSLEASMVDTGRASTVSCSASHQLPVSASKADALNRRRRIEKMTMMKQVSLSDDDAMWCDQRSDRFRAFIYIRCWLMTRLRQGDKDGLQIDDWLVLCCFSPFPFLKEKEKREKPVLSDDVGVGWAAFEMFFLYNKWDKGGIFFFFFLFCSSQNGSSQRR